MEIEKIRNLSDAELVVEGNKTAEQLFRLRFQLNLGQTDVVKKIRILRKDVARIQTVVRERELGLHGAQHLLKSVAGSASEAETEAAPKKAAAKKAAAKKSVKQAAPKKTAAKKAAKTSKTKKEAR